MPSLTKNIPAIINRNNGSIVVNKTVSPHQSTSSETSFFIVHLSLIITDIAIGVTAALTLLKIRKLVIDLIWTTCLITSFIFAVLSGITLSISTTNGSSTVVYISKIFQYLTEYSLAVLIWLIAVGTAEYIYESSIEQYSILKTKTGIYMILAISSLSFLTMLPKFMSFKVEEKQLTIGAVHLIVPNSYGDSEIFRDYYSWILYALFFYLPYLILIIEFIIIFPRKRKNQKNAPASLILHLALSDNLWKKRMHNILIMAVVGFTICFTLPFQIINNMIPFAKNWNILITHDLYYEIGLTCLYVYLFAFYWSFTIFCRKLATRINFKEANNVRYTATPLILRQVVKKQNSLGNEINDKEKMDLK